MKNGERIVIAATDREHAGSPFRGTAQTWEGIILTQDETYYLVEMTCDGHVCGSNVGNRYMVSKNSQLMSLDVDKVSSKKNPVKEVPKKRGFWSRIWD